MSKGDHIYVECFPHDHHGIDCGDGTVIHYSSKFTNGKIMRTSKSKFADGKIIKRKNYSSNPHSARSNQFLNNFIILTA
jgi:hypothetical protein